MALAKNIQRLRIHLEVARPSSAMSYSESCFVRIRLFVRPSCISLAHFHTRARARADLIVYPFVLINSIYNKHVHAVRSDTSQSKPFLYAHPLHCIHIKVRAILSRTPGAYNRPSKSADAVIVYTLRRDSRAG